MLRGGGLVHGRSITSAACLCLVPLAQPLEVSTGQFEPPGDECQGHLQTKLVSKIGLVDCCAECEAATTGPLGCKESTQTQGPTELQRRGRG